MPIFCVVNRLIGKRKCITKWRVAALFALRNGNTWLAAHQLGPVNFTTCKLIRTNASTSSANLLLQRHNNNSPKSLPCGSKRLPTLNTTCGMVDAPKPDDITPPRNTQTLGHDDSRAASSPLFSAITPYQQETNRRIPS